MTQQSVTSAFTEKLGNARHANRSMLCVGLDPELTSLPDGFAQAATSVAAFNRAIIDATSDVACCYKANLGFYLAFGAEGVDALAQVRSDVPAHIPVMLDAKFGDIDITSRGYARAVFDVWKFDAVTVNPFLGRDALQPFLDYADRGIFVLAKTSNEGSGLLQDRVLANDEGLTVSQTVARHATEWNVRGNVGLVVGATYPRQIAELRSVAPDLPFLIPGVGAQAGDLKAAVRAGVDRHGAGIIVNASRAISFASTGRDFKDAARTAAIALRDAINAAVPQAGR
ncbi:MAG TPA: orotidine-5'-phosphate decarboxylase [Thermomicrobiales bacterium]|nr:orotidine-5'-phosphate decarboxylase [Thermomicrobiales bacterium]